MRRRELPRRMSVALRTAADSELEEAQVVALTLKPLAGPRVEPVDDPRAGAGARVSHGPGCSTGRQAEGKITIVGLYLTPLTFILDDSSMRSIPTVQARLARHSPGRFEHPPDSLRVGQRARRHHRESCPAR